MIRTAGKKACGSRFWAITSEKLQWVVEFAQKKDQIFSERLNEKALIFFTDAL